MVFHEICEYAYEGTLASCPFVLGVLTWLTDRYPSDTIHNANSGDLDRLILEALYLIVYRNCFGVEGLGDQSYIVDPCLPVDQLSIDSTSEWGGFTHKTNAAH